MTVQDAVCDLSDGNPGAINAMMSVIVNRPAVEVGAFILSLVTLDLTGPRIWVGFKDCAETDPQKFFDLVVRLDQNMIEVCDRECPKIAADEVPA